MTSRNCYLSGNVAVKDKEVDTDEGGQDDLDPFGDNADELD